MRVVRVRQRTPEIIREVAIEYGSIKLGVTPEGGGSAPISVERDPVLMIQIDSLADRRGWRSSASQSRGIAKKRADEKCRGYM